MVVGDMVIEVSEVKDRPEVLFVDLCDRKGKDTCAIYVSKSVVSQRIQVGDTVWWQGLKAFWTPQRVRLAEDATEFDCGVHFDIEIPRVGHPGIVHPYRRGVKR